VINRIDIQGREPGRRVLEAIAAHPKINPAWVLTGEGEPLLEAAPTGGKPIVLPVAKAALPGPPAQHGELLTEEAIDFQNFFTKTQYWLRLNRGDLILNDPRGLFQVHDLLLIETDRRKFPAKDRLSGHLCVVKIPSGDEPSYLLGQVDYHEAEYHPSPAPGPPHLMVDIFEREIPKEERVEQIVINRYPNGEISCGSRVRQLVPFRGRKRVADPTVDFSKGDYPIDYADVVGVWTGLRYRVPSF
jgi:hypothetical protein